MTKAASENMIEDIVVSSVLRRVDQGPEEVINFYYLGRDFDSCVLFTEKMLARFEDTEYLIRHSGLVSVKAYKNRKRVNCQAYCESPGVGGIPADSVVLVHQNATHSLVNQLILPRVSVGGETYFVSQDSEGAFYVDYAEGYLEDIANLRKLVDDFAEITT